MASVQKTAKKRLVAVSDKGHLVGESHGRALLSRHDVEIVHELRAQGLTLGQIAKAMEVSKGCIQHILAGRTWQCAVVTWRRVSLRK